MNNDCFPWHKGEVLMQQRLGVAERMAQFGPRVVREFMPDQHREFYAELPFLLLGSVDGNGDVWAGTLEGQPGFAHSPDPHTLRVDRRFASDDPAAAGDHDGAAVGLLGIELKTRRRNRLNGHVRSSTATGFSVAVEHAFGNCPKYIQAREFGFARNPDERSPTPAEFLAGLDAAARRLIGTADTFFVASYIDPDGDEARRQVDVSHRGGNSGFVHVDGDCLTIPDFSGNKHFNTLGNLLLNPRAGLLFIDFESGDLLQVSGNTEIVFDGPALAAFHGAERLWRVRVKRAVRRRGALALRWVLHEMSAHSMATGSWGRPD